MGVYQTPNRTFFAKSVVDYTPANFMQEQHGLTCRVVRKSERLAALNEPNMRKRDSYIGC